MELPDSVKKAIGDQAGIEIFTKSFDSARTAGSSELVAFAKGWQSLIDSGYEADEDGVFKNQDDSFSFEYTISKFDEEQKLVYGWASVIEENGVAVEDHQGDVIDVPDLLKAAHGFISEHRVNKVMHEGEAVGEFVESMVFTKEVQKALGIDLKKVGWFVGLQVKNETVWKMVKDGRLAMFSIGGRAQRIDNV